MGFLVMAISLFLLQVGAAYSATALWEQEVDAQKYQVFSADSSVNYNLSKPICVTTTSTSTACKLPNRGSRNKVLAVRAFRISGGVPEYSVFSDEVDWSFEKSVVQRRMSRVIYKKK